MLKSVLVLQISGYFWLMTVRVTGQPIDACISNEDGHSCLPVL